MLSQRNNNRKYMKIRFSSDDDDLWEKNLEIHEIEIIIRPALTVFNDNNEYYPQAFLNECLYKSVLQM